MIKLENVNKSFGELILFENLNLKIDKKKTKIKGENGTGKSVLLKMIVGYSTPDSGRIFYDTDKLLGKDSDFLQDAGISINAPQFMKTWTGLENLQYLANIRKICTDKELMELIRIFDLEKVIKKKYKTYSLGMQQKLRIIQALMDKPKYLILDEPFEALDKKTKLITRNYLDSYLSKNSDRKLIYTSHDETDDDFAECILEINDKKIHIIK
ncbi:MAG: ATP-binding cassette domain-containing protein [Thomasclavelia sp.]|uniref:ATP-binding cassette domain-containing protein n=1 Tax=Thomasclavelia sp. TaxID=3025757 RepID=UPI0039A15E06